ncbi:MAG: fimbrial biogenesis outer membrane usher protein [Gammaproteobacteria bacterium]|nr:fimbria/pilus outer membrane usher protein [Gammaproteobacteria bacterium]MDE1984709.1 fimbrial biogenesis outer membrane usher protein [Gammaproteobacteria bacterium]MDE2109042.1 fimbrial biogenesis outer membrane usher protein [Gammaproteobacteria bacterium]MDE2461454.1 fimbrial biogenesis outer membrane usher protein [Gammaproteobacteria bacterium]
MLEVHLNQQPWHETDLFLGFGATADKNLYAKGTDLERWRLRLPAVQPYLYQGEKFYPLDAIPGLTYHVNAATETLLISAPPSDFTGSVVDGLFPHNPQPQHTPLGGFLNYDFLGSRSPVLSSVNGLLQAGVFNDWGVGTSSFIGQDITHAHSHWTRLDTTWTHDDPDDMTTLQLGDSITNGGMTGLPVRLGGVQYGTNFATRPYFITFPLPTIGGQTALPSTVQLYVNGVLKESQQVAPGPFSVPAVPVVTGPGNATLVVRDILGREQVISESFYASSNLLKSGLNDYAFSAGKLRENYGLDSNDYGPFAATGLFRHGFSDVFTGELRAESSAGLQDASVGATWAAPRAGIFNAALAASHSPLGSGVLGLIGYQWQGETFNAGLNTQLASPRFTELGYNGLPAPHKQITASVGAFMGRAGSASLAYLDQSSPLFGHTRLLTASYSVNMGPGFFSASGYHTLTASSNGVILMFTLPFGERSNLSFGVQRQNNVDQGFAQVQEGLPAGTGSGYRVSTQVGPDAFNQAEYDYQNGVGTYRVGALNGGDQTTYQGEASGGLAFIGGGVFPTRQINGAFGLVQVPGIPDVTVYADNQAVGVTDKNGDALVPALRPYQNNPVSLDAQGIPLSAQVEALQQNAVPRFNSGVIVKFPVTSLRGATLTIQLADGKPLPAGANVQILGQTQEFPVGLDGEVYVTGLAAQNTLRASWNDESCDISVSLPNTKDPLPDLGTFVCREIKP